MKDKDFKRISIQNSTFLKNAKIFSDISKTLYWDSRPILSYYSISQLFSFFINSITIFPIETKTFHHGLRIEINENPKYLKIKFNDNGGSFHRIVKTLSSVYNGSIFSDYIIDFSRKGDKINLFPNKNIFSIENGKQKSFLLKQLYELSDDKIRNLLKKIKTNWIHKEMKQRFFLSTKLLKNYILIFTAGYLSRYYPYIWEKIYDDDLSGDFLYYKKAIENIDEIVSFVSNELKRFEEKQSNGFIVNLDNI